MLVTKVLEYRNAKYARDLMNDKKNGTKKLAELPGLQQLILEMHRAQVNNAGI